MCQIGKPSEKWKYHYSSEALEYSLLCFAKFRDIDHIGIFHMPEAAASH